MKLLNHTLSYLSVALLLVIGVWAFVFYINMLDEIYDSIDDGLANSKILIIDKVKTDTTLIHKTTFMESNYAIHEISQVNATPYKDVYMDSVLFMQNESDYEPVRILKTAFRAQNGKYYELDIVSSMVEEDDLIEDLLYAILWLYLILLVSVLLINNVLLKKIWRPFYAILDKLKNFELGSREELPIIKTHVQEFNDLNETVSSLLKRTIDTFNSQKQFIENASHELQTPLAISINKLELLTEKNSMTDGQLEEVGGIIQSLERLTRLNKSLLLLSKIENRQFSEAADVNFNALAERLVSDFSDLSAFKSVKIVIEQQDALVEKMNPELASMMLSNLLKNAIVHNHEGGVVTLKISSSVIMFENTSDTLPLDDAQVFTRFYKNSSSPTSTGLGLAIVKSIADYYNLIVRYEYDGKHKFYIGFK